MSMNLCPPEIHSYICQLACLDDGRTVRALSLVSKYFRQISRPFLYQSLSISGSAQITALDSVLQKTPPHLRLVRHLFLSTHENDTYVTHTPKITDAADSASILRILTICAPTLETLSFVALSASVGTVAISRLFRTSFPWLRELSISGFYPFPSAPGKLPSLQSLHLHGNRNPHGLLQAGGLDEACPSLTRLHVSGLSMATSFTLELQAAFAGDDESPFPSKLPSRLRHVVIQPASPPPVSGKDTANIARDEMMMAHLEKLDPPQGMDFTLLPRISTDRSYDAFKREWSDRLGRI
ncbi:hypothetical protein C0989_008225 [Termitomyces sp. Mn162]|nr:hypothetical protein C0989_008225 [Termitomyces sp. Mn162]KAH0591396.1 hypothetical protein H2248_001476 [Termitomyces sp. 'cryptogamus']